jgi:hypothetical protein
MQYVCFVLCPARLWPAATSQQAVMRNVGVGVLGQSEEA